ncbi:RsmB/NOP family class I SAM-dependent RNA methyltransferase [Sphingomonas montanisoli]|uniref:RsmB/NOP family class I SAM-dependent RNA methyltransferase n=1 Tax=Sphingomonas montanisoli TaxID=2606412 RepID=A0A5D9CCD8_9SPHN|nr:RsmB/NOP family class I SAM-dependent RNA methyltransferase [Sphingomonas montanisoli]TZG28997.1 RsmB/NOP family class I SAM-dependent RNA methyltransferase [Sphingomonas montanisoli]
MTPQARAQAAIDLLDEIVASARDAGAAADTLIARYFKTRRYAGSKDRRAVRELVYRAIRRAGERPVDGRAALVGLAREDAALAALFDGSPHCPAPIAPDEAGSPAAALPAWLAAKVAPILGETGQLALLERASLDLRVNSARTTRDAMLAALPEAKPTAHSPVGLRLPEGTKVEASIEWAQGLVEIQDEGSQLISLATRAGPGMTVLDLCAGAGGKTLALAAMMQGGGRLIAADTDRSRLARLAPRAERAGAAGIENRLLNPNREGDAVADLVDGCDVVLIDAPCSGTGTWRRNPEARWRLTPDRLARLTAIQSHLLDIAFTLVKPGGALVYAVCSVLDEEGAGQVQAFVDRMTRTGARVQSDKDLFTAGAYRGPGKLLTPEMDGTDGFFVARLIKA